MITLDLAAFDQAADEIERRGFWDGSASGQYSTSLCIGIALCRWGGPLERQHLARQLGWTGMETSGIDALGFIYAKNDEFKGRPEEGKAWAVGTLRKLARGKSLV